MKKFWGALVHKVREWFSLDYRSIAALRIGVGITLLLDTIQRSFDLRAFYSDAGILPRAEYLRLWENKWWISVHMASGLSGFEAVLLAVAAIFAIMLILGYRTRFAMIASWFLLVSLQMRNPVILQGGDVLFRVVLFWMMFLPLGKVWSLDRLFNRTARPTKESHFSAATVAYIIQICLLYIFTGVLKTGAAWHDGTAVYYALNVDQLITPVGAYLRELPSVMKVFTYMTWYLETYGVLLFFSPIATGFFRTMGIFLFACLQIGFNSSMRLGLFGMIAIVVTFGLLPSGFWNEGWNTFTNWIASKGKKGLTIYYDFECSFCYKISYLLKRVLLLNPETVVLAAHTNSEIEKIMEEKNSWVLVDAEGKKYTTWNGVVAVLTHSPLFFWIAWVAKLPIISDIGETVYALISRKRKLVCVPEPIETTPTGVRRLWHIFVEITVVFLLVYIIAWNIDTLEGNRPKIISPKMQSIGWFTHLDQKFNMFAPTPLTEDGWYVMPGKLRDGTEVNVMNGAEEVTYTKPEWVSYTYKNQRWQKYLMNLWSRDFSEYRLSYGRYLCREWNTESRPHDKQLLTFEMIFIVENTPPPGVTPAPVVPTTIWSHSCF
jgi:predicted DCC family thiol-disulfide oxidoreductase YuxK